MAESIYNSEDYLSNSVSTYGATCQCSNQRCQTSCEKTCQALEGCSTCQTTCEKSCQSTCEKSCQCSAEGCQTTCQKSCQCSSEGCQSCNTCQCVAEGCESCQTSCQKSCQTTCEKACQSTCEKSCQDTCESSCQDTCELACQTCQDTCQLACQCSNQRCQTSCESSCQATEGCSVCQTACEKACQSCNTCQTVCESACQDTCESSCQSTCQKSCQDACEKACQNDQCYECQASCQICNSKQSHCAKNKQKLTQHIGSMPVPTVGQKVRTKDYTDIATYLNKAIAAGKWSLSLLPTEVAVGTPINRSTLDTFISYVRTISGSYLDKKDSKISVSDITTLKGYLDGTNIPDNVPCCENTGYEGCVTEQCAASKCQDNYQ